MSFGENSLSPKQKMVRQIFLSCDFAVDFAPQEEHKKDRVTWCTVTPDGTFWRGGFCFVILSS